MSPIFEIITGSNVSILVGERRIGLIEVINRTDVEKFRSIHCHQKEFFKLAFPENAWIRRLQNYFSCPIHSEHARFWLTPLLIRPAVIQKLKRMPRNLIDLTWPTQEFYDYLFLAHRSTDSIISSNLLNLISKQEEQWPCDIFL